MPDTVIPLDPRPAERPPDRFGHCPVFRSPLQDSVHAVPAAPAIDPAAAGRAD